MAKARVEFFISRSAFTLLPASSWLKIPSNVVSTRGKIHYASRVLRAPSQCVTMLRCKIVFRRLKINFMGWFDLRKAVRPEFEMIFIVEAGKKRESNEMHLIDWIMKSSGGVEIIIVKRILHGTCLININDGNSAVPGRERLWDSSQGCVMNVFVAFWLILWIPPHPLSPEIDSRVQLSGGVTAHTHIGWRHTR